MALEDLQDVGGVARWEVGVDVKRAIFCMVVGGGACQVLVINEIGGLVCVCWEKTRWLCRSRRLLG